MHQPDNLWHQDGQQALYGRRPQDLMARRWKKEISCQAKGHFHRVVSLNQIISLMGKRFVWCAHQKLLMPANGKRKIFKEVLNAFNLEIYWPLLFYVKEIHFPTVKNVSIWDK